MQIKNAFKPHRPLPITYTLRPASAELAELMLRGSFSASYFIFLILFLFLFLYFIFLYLSFLTDLELSRLTVSRSPPLTTNNPRAHQARSVGTAPARILISLSVSPILLRSLFFFLLILFVFLNNFILHLELHEYTRICICTPSESLHNNIHSGRGTEVRTPRLRRDLRKSG